MPINPRTFRILWSLLGVATSQLDRMVQSGTLTAERMADVRQFFATFCARLPCPACSTDCLRDLVPALPTFPFARAMASGPVVPPTSGAAPHGAQDAPESQTMPATPYFDWMVASRRTVSEKTGRRVYSAAECVADWNIQAVRNDVWDALVLLAYGYPTPTTEGATPDTASLTEQSDTVWFLTFLGYLWPGLASPELAEWNTIVQGADAVRDRVALLRTVLRLRLEIGRDRRMTTLMDTKKWVVALVDSVADVPPLKKSMPALPTSAASASPPSALHRNERKRRLPAAPVTGTSRERDSTPVTQHWEAYQSAVAPHPSPPIHPGAGAQDKGSSLDGAVSAGRQSHAARLPPLLDDLNAVMASLGTLGGKMGAPTLSSPLTTGTTASVSGADSARVTSWTVVVYVVIAVLFFLLVLIGLTYSWLRRQHAQHQKQSAETLLSSYPSSDETARI